ncbi:MAG: hypothetical protein IJ157_10660 [Clostridia bacterium]|nr:hypothetical protein [Clostridia bacterium]
MKKLVSLILALMMACMLLPAMAEAADVIGDWYLTEVQMGEDTLPPSVLGMEMTITLNEDGTALFVTAYGEDVDEDAVTWKMGDGAVIISMGEDGDQDFVMEDDLLKFDMGGALLVFSQEAPEIAALPQVIAAESEDAFLGEWTLTTIGAGGALLPADALGADGTLTVEAGKLTLISGEDTIEGETTLTEDGKLAIGDGSMALELNDNGWLSITQQFDEETVMTMYFEQAVEAAE